MTGNRKVFGVAGWKNSGKTTLVTALVAEFAARGLKVSTVKHAHHQFDVDHPGRDSWKHRQAGASETVVISRVRWAIMHELRDEPEPSLNEVLEKISPCDLVLVEGYKHERHERIEILRDNAEDRPPLWPHDDGIVAIVSGTLPDDCPLPGFAPDRIDKIAGFIATRLGLVLPKKLSDAAE